MQGLNYPCASKVPVQHRRQAFTSVMTSLARLHGFIWVYTITDQKTEYLDSAGFFQHQVRVVCRLLIMDISETMMPYLKHARPMTSKSVNIN